jgi:trans-2,3-dihydro-3-hydroxyanthranilate isomerase
MREYAFRLVNVFATDATLSGNPLCVFEDGRGLSDAEMLAIALQFNLSETTFVLPSADADARVRIFTPNGEMPFAGHPTLGTAFVVAGACDGVRLEMQAGIIPVAIRGDRLVLTANAPRWRAPECDRDTLAATLGLDTADLAPTPLWMDTGNEQLLVPLVSADALARATPVAALAARWRNPGGMVKIHCFVDGAEVAEAPGVALPVRFFFEKQPGVIAEDAGTGSACANLGGWWIATGRALPRTATIHQGDHLGRACRLDLAVGADQSIRVGGRVVEVARGVFGLP